MPFKMVRRFAAPVNHTTQGGSMRKFFTIGFWDYALERALKTAIQVLVAGGLLGQELFAWDWQEIGSLAGAAAITSIAMSFLAYKGDGTDNPNTK